MMSYRYVMMLFSNCFPITCWNDFWSIYDLGKMFLMLCSWCLWFMKKILFVFICFQRYFTIKWFGSCTDWLKYFDDMIWWDLELLNVKTRLTSIDFKIFYWWFMIISKETLWLIMTKMFIRPKDWYSRFKDDDYEKMKRYDECPVKLSLAPIVWNYLCSKVYEVQIINYKPWFPMCWTMVTWKGIGPWTSALHCPTYDWYLWFTIYDLWWDWFDSLLVQHKLMRASP